MATTTTSTATTHLAIRTKQGIVFYEANPSNNWAVTPIKSVDEVCEKISYSPDGSLFAACFKDRLALYDAQSMQVVKQIVEPFVYELSWSPMSTFLVTLRKFVPDDPQGGNLCVWRLADPPMVDLLEEEANNTPSTPTTPSTPQVEEKEEEVKQETWQDANGNVCVFKMSYKPTMEEHWPLIQWNANESLAACLMTHNHSLHFYHGKTMKYRNRMNKKRVNWYAMSAKNLVAVYMPENAQHAIPAMIQVFRHPNFTKPLCSTICNNVTSVELKWNAPGTSLLVKTLNEKTDKSYYGEFKLYLMKASDNTVMNVSLKQEEQIHSIEWTPKQPFNEFYVAFGVPPQIIIFNDKLQEVHKFESAPRNKIMFSQQGKLVSFCGMGTFKGGFAFWDVASQKRKLLGTCNANDASHISWSPDSAWFLSATQTPTLRVDNKLQLWKYNGLLKFEQKFECLYQAIWRPVPNMPARPTSPVGVQEGQQQKAQQPVAKAYVPPHMRAQQAQEQQQQKKPKQASASNKKK